MQEEGREFPAFGAMIRQELYRKESLGRVFGGCMNPRKLLELVDFLPTVGCALYVFEEALGSGCIVPVVPSMNGDSACLRRRTWCCNIWSILALSQSLAALDL